MPPFQCEGTCLHRVKAAVSNSQQPLDIISIQGPRRNPSGCVEHGKGTFACGDVELPNSSASHELLCLNVGSIGEHENKLVPPIPARQIGHTDATYQGFGDSDENAIPPCHARGYR